MRYVANIDLLFSEAGDLAARLHAAADAGFDAVEFWRWEDVDLDALAQASSDRGVEITAFVTDWSIRVADPAQRARFLSAIDGALAAARRLACTRLVVTLGDLPEAAALADVHDTLLQALRVAVARAEAAGVTLLIEAVNTAIDHPGAAVATAPDARGLVAAIDHPRLRMLFDVYHSVAQGEDVYAEIAASASWIDYVQIAEVPGRHEPDGAGEISWPAVRGALDAAGYDGPIGFEFSPSADSVTAVHTAQRVWRAAAGATR